MKKFLARFCLLALLAALPGCAHKPEEPPCPATGLVPGAGAYPVIAAAPGRAHLAAGDLTLIGKLRTVRGVCSFKHYQKTKNVDVDITLTFVGRRGAKGADLKGAEFPYFVAVISPDDVILQRQEFSTTVDFDKNGFGASTEEFAIHIPVTAKEKAQNYAIAAGFKVSQRQIDYNRENHED